MAPRKNLKYTEGQMLKALEECRRGIPVKRAAKENGVPRTTLLYKLTGKNPVERKIGKPTVFSAHEEDVLCKWVLEMSKRGLPVSKTLFLKSVQSLAVKLKKPKFVKSLPTDKFYHAFLKRHTSISARICQNLIKSRKNVTREQLQNWGKEVEECLTEMDAFCVLNDPRRVFNADETAFFLNPKGESVLAEKGSRTVYQECGNDEKECLTVMIAGNAMGEMVPPMVVFRYQRIPADLVESVPSDWGIGRSERGWMNHELFFYYMCNIFHKWLIDNEIPLPVILFVDGHVSHISIEVAEFCSRSGIELIALYPNSTHLMQPMDVAVFRNVKREWKNAVKEWKFENDRVEVKKRDFCQILKPVLRKTFTEETLKNGFRACGLVPFNVSAITLPTDSRHKPPQQQCTADPRFLSQLKELLGDVDHNESSPQLKELWERAVKKYGVVQQTPDQPNSMSPTVDDVVAQMDAEAVVAFTPHKPDQANSISLTVDDAVARTDAEPVIASIPQTPDQPNSMSLTVDDVVAQTDAEAVVAPAPPTPDHPCWLVSPFKSCLRWPRDDCTSKKKKRCDPIPSVLTSSHYKQYLDRKTAEKMKMEGEKAARKLARLEKRREREEEILKKKTARRILFAKRQKKCPRSSGTSESDEVEEDDKQITKCEEDFVLVRFLTERKQEKYYVGKIIAEPQSSGAEVSFLRKKVGRRGIHFEYPMIADVAFIFFDQICARLPYSVNRARFTFPSLRDTIDIKKVL